MARLATALLLALLGCDGCEHRSDPYQWLIWHNYEVRTLERVESPTIGSWPCDQGWVGWRATADRKSPEWESDCDTIRATVMVCCPANGGPCRGRETEKGCAR